MSSFVLKFAISRSVQHFICSLPGMPSRRQGVLSLGEESLPAGLPLAAVPEEAALQCDILPPPALPQTAPDVGQSSEILPPCLPTLPESQKNQLYISNETTFDNGSWAVLPQDSLQQQMPSNKVLGDGGWTAQPQDSILLQQQRRPFTLLGDVWARLAESLHAERVAINVFLERRHVALLSELRFQPMSAVQKVPHPQVSPMPQPQVSASCVEPDLGDIRRSEIAESAEARFNGTALTTAAAPITAPSLAANYHRSDSVASTASKNSRVQGIYKKHSGDRARAQGSTRAMNSSYSLASSTSSVGKTRLSRAYSVNGGFEVSDAEIAPDSPFGSARSRGAQRFSEFSGGSCEFHSARSTTQRRSTMANYSQLSDFAGCILAPVAPSGKAAAVKRLSAFVEIDKATMDIITETGELNSGSLSGWTGAASWAGFSGMASQLGSRKSLNMLRQTMHFRIDDPDKTDWMSFSFWVLMPCIIVTSVVVEFAQSIRPVPIGTQILKDLDASLSVVFILECMIRVFVYPNLGSFFRTFSSTQLFLMFDLAAAVPLEAPFYLGLIERDENPLTEEFLVFCLPPFLRLLKMLRYMPNFHLLSHAAVLLQEALPTMLFVMLIMLWFFASLIFMVEPTDNIHSLSHAMWFTLQSMTTVGWGDVTPVTDQGRMVAAVLVIVSYMYMAMPLGIIGNIFTSVWTDRDRILLMKTTRKRLAQWGYTAADIPGLFSQFDVRGVGELDIFAFRQMINQMHIGFDDKRIDALFLQFDLDNSGAIDAPEFVRTLFPRTFHTLYGAQDDDVAIAECAASTTERTEDMCYNSSDDTPEKADTLNEELKDDGCRPLKKTARVQNHLNQKHPERQLTPGNEDGMVDILSPRSRKLRESLVK